MLPFGNTETMPLHLAGIALASAPGGDGVVPMGRWDQRPWVTRVGLGGKPDRPTIADGDHDGGGVRNGPEVLQRTGPQRCRRLHALKTGPSSPRPA